MHYKDVFSSGLPDEATIFSTEEKGTELAIEHIKMSKYTHYTLFSESLSCLQSLHSMNIDHPYILDKLYSYYYACNQDKKSTSAGFQTILAYMGTV